MDITRIKVKRYSEQNKIILGILLTKMIPKSQMIIGIHRSTNTCSWHWGYHCGKEHYKERECQVLSPWISSEVVLKKNEGNVTGT